MNDAAQKKGLIPARSLGCLGLLAGLAVLAISLGWVLLRFGTPQPTLVDVGMMEDYPAGQAPRLFSVKEAFFYVLNTNGELIAVTARSNHQAGCMVHWSAAENAFIDPCLGTHFSPHGEYWGKGPPGELSRLPLQVRDNQVWVNLGYRRN